MPSVQTPIRCRGPLRECLRRDSSLTEAQWHRGQMRGYAGFWRRRKEIAAILGDSVANFAGVNLTLARVHRELALRLEESGGDRQIAATTKGGVR